jgi:hypothetical protein
MDFGPRGTTRLLKKTASQHWEVPSVQPLNSSVLCDVLFGGGFASNVRKMHLDRVSTVRGSGWVKTFDPKIHSEYRTLDIDPPATAGGTDPVQVQVVTFEAKLFGGKFHRRASLLSSTSR